MKTTNAGFLMLCSLLLGTQPQAADIADGELSVFSPNTTISSSQVNGNFNALKNGVNTKQDKVVNNCTGAGQAIKTINANGTTTCEAVSGGGVVSSVAGQTGLTNVGGNTTGDVKLTLDTGVVQTEAVKAMGDTLNTNPLNHDRYTNGEAVNAIKAADGAGSGLDADLLDGKNSTAFAASNQACSAGQMVTGVNINGAITCASPPPPPVRVLPGTVNAAGNINSGSGFTLTNPSTGTYRITFTTPFANSPAVTANPWTIAGYVQVRLIAPSYFEMDILNTAGTKTNAGFTFIAAGNP